MIYPYYTNTSQMPVQKTAGSSSSHIPFAVGTAIAGGVIGMLSVIGWNIDTFHIFGRIIATFSELSTGLFLWAVLCTGIAVLAKSRVQAVTGVMCFLAAMLTGYFLTGRIFHLDYNSYLLFFRALAIIPSGLAALAAWHLRCSGLLRNLACIPAGLCLLFDLRIMWLSDMPLLLCEFALGLLFLAILRYAAQQDVHPPVPYYSAMQAPRWQ